LCVHYVAVKTIYKTFIVCRREDIIINYINLSIQGSVFGLLIVSEIAY
jgi:hypothetical protein